MVLYIYKDKIKLELDHSKGRHDYLISTLLPGGVWTDPISKKGVTSYLKVIPKFLEQWSANEASNYWLNQLRDGLTKDKWAETYDEARYKHREKSEAGMSQGTDLHTVCEEWLQDPTYSPEVDETVSPEVFEMFFRFREWWNDNNWEVIGVETPCYSLSLDYCGKCDFIAKTSKGKIILGDIKSTKSGVYLENFYQLGGYALTLLEEGAIQKIDDMAILNPNVLENGSMKPIMASHFGFSVKDAIRSFAYCKTLSDDLTKWNLKYKEMR